MATRTILCPNPKCSYYGPARRKSRGSIPMGLFLTFFGVLPGLIYFMSHGGFRYYCPECGLQVGSDD